MTWDHEASRSKSRWARSFDLHANGTDALRLLVHAASGVFPLEPAGSIVAMTKRATTAKAGKRCRAVLWKACEQLRSEAPLSIPRAAEADTVREQVGTDQQKNEDIGEEELQEALAEEEAEVCEHFASASTRMGGWISGDFEASMGALDVAPELVSRAV